MSIQRGFCNRLANLPKVGLSFGVRLPEQLFDPFRLAAINLYQIVVPEKAGLDLPVRGDAQAGAVSAKFSIIHRPDHLHLHSIQEIFLAPVHLTSFNGIRLGSKAQLNPINVSGDAEWSGAR